MKPYFIFLFPEKCKFFWRQKSFGFLSVSILMLVLAVSININSIMAVGFSPSSLIYELNTGEEGCQMITVNSDSDTIALSDNWAENKDIEWRVNSFNTSADSHSIVLNYPSVITKNDKQAKICLKAYKAGEYHGILLLKEEQKGNSIIQMGIWLKAVVKGNDLTSQMPKTTTDSEEDVLVVETEPRVVESTSVDSNNVATTGNAIANVVSDNKNNSIYYWSIGILAVLIIGILIFIFNKKRDPFKL